MYKLLENNVLSENFAAKLLGSSKNSPFAIWPNLFPKSSKRVFRGCQQFTAYQRKLLIYQQPIYYTPNWLRCQQLHPQQIVQIMYQNTAILSLVKIRKTVYGDMRAARADRQANPITRARICRKENYNHRTHEDLSYERTDFEYHPPPYNGVWNL